MDSDEKLLFVDLLKHATSYTEFGTGGSTILAATLLRGQVTSVDSSKEWIERVGVACERAAVRARPRFIYADIGPVVAWGQPADESCRDRWPLYSLSVWQDEGAKNADVFLVDGRFRVACFLETLFRCSDAAKIAIHDYAPRPSYHVIEKFAECVAVSGSLSVFQRIKTFDWREATRILDHARFDRG